MIDVSFVMTVYNKEYYLPSVLKALFNQTGLKNPEFIFVDDLSNDCSVEIIEKMTEGMKNVKIILNTENKGISPRTNQGLAEATGKYVRFLDSDDILPLDSTEKMIALAELHNADMVYGKFTKTGIEPSKLTEKYLESFTYKYSSDALKAVLTGKFTRMGQLIKTEVLKKAGGADERVFIQDESVPLRAALYANGIVKMQANVVLVPKEIGNFSGNKIQLDHDRFLAYANVLLDNPKLPKKYTKLIYARAVSAYWKYIKKAKTLPYLRWTFFVYLWSKLFKPTPNIKRLKHMKTKFLKVFHIRRTEKCC